MTRHRHDLARKLYARPPSCLEETLVLHLKAAGLPEPVREHRFHAKRKWRFDLAWPDLMLAVECEGGIWTGGRHTRPKGFQADLEKYNQAVLMGWRLLRFSSDQIKSGEALATIEAALAADQTPGIRGHGTG